jgi:ATP-binding cassette subfamily G (WHITE) protein 2
MGSSGGGKTTLLSTISLRLDSSKMETIGTIRLNGNEYSTAVLKAMSAYVLQDDLLHAELTVKETIKYAADLRLSGKMDDKGRKQRQKDVIALMGIEHISDTIIGDTRRKGISGGERKRVCVAIELLTAPKLMFLDEVGTVCTVSTVRTVDSSSSSITPSSPLIPSSSIISSSLSS